MSDHQRNLYTMKTNTQEKEFDAVKFMRQQRDRISNEISDFTYDELMDYLKRTSTQEIKPSA